MWCSYLSSSSSSIGSLLDPSTEYTALKRSYLERTTRLWALSDGSFLSYQRPSFPSKKRTLYRWKTKRVEDEQDKDYDNKNKLVISRKYEGHTEDVWDLTELDDNRFATISYDCNIQEDSTVKVWDKKTCECLETLRSPVLSFMKMSDGSTVLFGFAGGRFEFRRISNLEVVKAIQLPRNDQVARGNSRMLCELEDGTFLFYYEDERQIQRWDLSTMQDKDETLLQTLTVADLTEISEVFELNKDTIVAVTQCETIIWRLSTGERLQQTSYSKLLGSVKLSEGYFATFVPWVDVGDDDIIELWNEHGECYATYTIDYCVSALIKLADGSIVTYEREEYGIRSPKLRIHKQLPFSSLVDRCCLEIVTRFEGSWEDLNQVIQGLPVELRQLLYKFYHAT
eukprot:TRINITY_DN5632_c0_g2_i4.p1 TRINITY_DN5632_c0_g2~~TRINITY_DN5632_c0_g2_i4.p1  ORF type:complete len:423 (+),score=70.17 TRINITY_DN5632_c0_g2_i4:79-1269(+)